MKLPGPDHPITIVPNGKRVRIMFAGRVIADTTHALTLKEASYKPVFYISRADADISLLKLTRSPHALSLQRRCKYFTFNAGGRNAENAVWSYEQPFPALAEIKIIGVYPNAWTQ